MGFSISSVYDWTDRVVHVARDSHIFDAGWEIFVRRDNPLTCNDRFEGMGGTRARYALWQHNYRALS